jgi:hypothetical protein
MVALCIALTCTLISDLVVVVEIDEHKHEQYEYSCENKTNDGYFDFDHRPLVFAL